MMTNSCMICDECGKTFPLFNNDLLLQSYVGGLGWCHICRDCFQKRNYENKIMYSSNLNPLNVFKYYSDKVGDEKR